MGLSCLRNCKLLILRTELVFKIVLPCVRMLTATLFVSLTVHGTIMVHMVQHYQVKINLLLAISVTME